MHTRLGLGLGLLVLAIAAGSAPAALAQSTTGTIAGTAVDETGAALPGVSITLKRVETGTTRTAVTDEAGRYRAPGLDVGEYEITAELQGFQTAVRRGIQLTLGQELMINQTLTVGQLAEQIVVTGAAALVETTSSTVSQLVDERQIRQLPLNGRDFSELALTSIGVVQSPTTDRSLTRGMGTQFSVAGARPNMVSYLLDGTDISDQGGQSPGSAAGGMLGVETVREFQVITNNYSAEYGRSAGGIVSAITRSGTNQLRGGAFIFHRNDALDSRTYFDDPGEATPELMRNQYGFNVGGPLRKDKTFFFGSFEGLRQDKGRTLIARVPSRATRARTDIAANSRPYLEMYPVPNGAESGASGLYSEAVTEPTQEDYFVIKVDHTFSQKDSASIRYTFDDASTSEYLALPIFSNQHSNRNQYTTLEWKRLFSGSLLNDFRGAFNRTFQQTANVDQIEINPSLYFIPGTQFGALGVTGLDSLGTDTSVPFLVAYNVIQLLNSTTWTRGAHTVKGGMSFTRWINNQNAEFQPGGSYNFTSVDNFVRGIANTFESKLPGTSSDRYWRQNLLGFYAQDDWAVKPHLTLNLGVRYEFVTSPQEKYDRVASFRNPPYDLGPEVGYPLFDNPSHSNIAPRVGFAWDVTGDGKTALRGGGGIFYEPILANIYRTFGNRTPPFYAQASLTNPTFPHAVAGELPTSQQRLDLLEFELKNPYMAQYNLTVQRELLPQLSVTVGYVGSRGLNLFRNGEANQAIPTSQPPDGEYFFPASNLRRSGIWNAVRIRRTDGNSWYHGMVASANKRFSAGLQFQASYTMGNSRDEGSLAAGSQDFSNGFPARYFDDRTDNYGPSDYDVRHNFTFNYSWQLPFGENATGVAKAFAAGWQLSGIVTLRSGVPFTPVLSFDRARARPRAGGDGQRPNWAPGFDAESAVTGDPDQWFDPAAFTLPDAGTFGDGTRNELRGPGYAVWNAAVFKNFEIGGSRRLQFRLETFNLLNRANFALPARVVYAAGGVPVENAGEITDIVGTARQIQLGLKFEF